MRRKSTLGKEANEEKEQADGEEAEKVNEVFLDNCNFSILEIATLYLYYEAKKSAIE